MRRTTFAALALVALGAAPAAAHGDSTYRGECGYNSFAQETATGGRFVGVAHSDVVAYSPSDGNAVGATVTCSLYVNDAVADSASGQGYGPVLFADLVEFELADTDTVEFCTTVDFTTDDTPTAHACQGARTLECCPFFTDPVVEALDLAGAVAAEYADPVVCPALGGDFSVAGEPLWDCPPYDDPPNDFTEPRPGGGWNDGRAGFLAVSQRSGTESVAAACAFVATDDGIDVVGASTGTIRCRLEDTATGTPLYDSTASGSLTGTAAAFAGNVTVCVEGTAGAVTTGLHCRYGVPVR